MNVGKLSLDNIQKFGNYTSIHYEGRSYTNVEQDLYARTLASILIEHGVRPGDRVLVMMPNTPEIIAAFQAVWKIGAVIVPVTPMLNAREVGYLLQDSEAEVALTTPVLASRIMEAGRGVPTFKHLLVIGETTVEGTKNIEPLIKSTTAITTMANRKDDDLALLLYTSGTTGKPKGVMLTHNNMLSNAEAVASMDPSIEPFMMAMHVLPLSHSYGVMIMNVGCIYGFQAALLSHFDPLKALQTIERYKVKRFSAVPTMLNYLLNHPDREKYDTSSLDKVLSGGAALPNEVRVEFERVFKCEVYEGYGLSETAPTASGYRPGETYRVGSCGHAIPGVNICIQDMEGNKLGPGQVGEICIQGPNIMKGYWKNDQATRDAVIEGWFHSGDVGTMDKDGFVFITDRKKDLIIKGGENISPREIEEAIHEHPAVAECAVIGLADPVYGENICAVIVCKNGMKATEEEIKIHTSKYVTKYKIPAVVHFTSYLPKNPVGKILKRDIRAQMAQWAEKQAAQAKA